MISGEVSGVLMIFLAGFLDGDRFGDYGIANAKAVEAFSTRKDRRKMKQGNHDLKPVRVLRIGDVL